MAALPDTVRTTDLYERYAPRIFGYCLQRLRNREEAEDALQTTFLNAFRGLSRGVVPAAEGAWLFKIAENVCLSRHRASFRRRRIEAPGDLRVVEETIAAPQRADDELIPLEEALAEMPDTQRRALVLREWQGLSYREIADELEVSQSAVETLIFRARRGLARRLEAPRARLRRVGQMVDAGSLLAALKGALSTGAAVKAVVTTAAVTGLAVGVVVDPPQLRRHNAPKPTAPVAPHRGSEAQAPQVIADVPSSWPSVQSLAPKRSAKRATPAPKRAVRSKPVVAKRAVPKPPRLVQHTAPPAASATASSSAPAAAAPVAAKPKPTKPKPASASSNGKAQDHADPQPQVDKQPPDPSSDPRNQSDPNGQGKAEGKNK
jgi:RNA polymerase sigma factor (sigma-70 family)